MGRCAVRPVSGTALLARSQQPELPVQSTQRARVTVRFGFRLDTWPFPRSDRQITVRPSSVPRYWQDGRACSVGCHPPGAVPGWPLRPFHRQHALRAGLNELRGNLHVGIDIMARDYQRAYAMQSGRAHLIGVGTPDERVQVGAYLYWHIRHAVTEGQWVRAYSTVVGRVILGFHHLHLSELAGGVYLNPLRPYGRNLRPYTDTLAPVIGVPSIFRNGAAWVEAYDPQSFVTRIYDRTPILAPAALAWRIFRGRRPVGPLEFSFRSSQHIVPDSLRFVLFSPRAFYPGFHCWVLHVVCIPRWNYRLAGGLGARLPLSTLRTGRYRLRIYAWDYAGNVAARDTPLRIGVRAARLLPDEPGGHARSPDGD